MNSAAVAAAILVCGAASAASSAMAQTSARLMQNLAPASAGPATLAPPDLSKTIRGIKASRLVPDRVGEVMLGALGVHLEQTKLDDVRKSAGGVIAAKSDANGAKRWLCYTVETGRRLWLMADDIAGAPITTLIVQAQPGKAGDETCPQLSAQLTPMGMIANIAIGDRRDVVEAELGPAKGGEWVRYEKCAAVSVRNQPMQRCTEIALRYGNNRVLTMVVRQALAS